MNKSVTSKLVRLDGPIAKPIEQCLGCGNLPLPE
jgi:hypothetical protein